MSRCWMLALAFLCACGSDSSDRPATPVSGQVRCRSGAFDGTRGCVEGGAGSPVRVQFRDEMGSFSLIAASIGMDDALVFESVDPNLLGEDELPIYEGRLPPGRHIVSVMLRYAGDGKGVFSYLKDYRFNIKSRCKVDTAGSDTAIVVSGIEKGNMTTPIEDRPGVRYLIMHDGGRRRGRCVD
jgi:hypothetical protein